jgi:UDP-2-acetamido-2-deoxy-ribo-hexuluronate aminotransferase
MNDRPRLRDPIPFIDVAAQRRRLGGRIDEAIGRVLAHCRFLMGPEVEEVERELGSFCGAAHAIAVASGTDALILSLMAEGIGAGDAVFCPAFTFAATAAAVAFVHATPVFVDVEEGTFNLDPASFERAVRDARRLRLNPRAVIPVDLFGMPADYEAIGVIAARENLAVIADAAQSFGASFADRPVGTLAPITATSFFPSKPLACYGDGGALFTDDARKAELLRSLRSHGEGADKYDHVRVGLTGRLDTIQAAVLLEKLKIFPEEIAARERIARRYHGALQDLAIVPSVPSGRTSVWAQYTIRVEPDTRESLREALAGQGIPTAVHYPKPLNRQEAYRHCPTVAGGVPVANRLAGEVLSLPMHAYVDEPTQDRIVIALRRALSAAL